MLASVIANGNRGKNQRPFPAEQFIPKWDPDAPKQVKPQQSGEDMLKAAKTITKQSGGGGRGNAR